jgi:hypothetical protein
MKVFEFIFNTVLSLTSASNYLDARQMQCMQMTVYHEARGESFLGQYLVAKTIANRVQSPMFPESPCEVVAQRNQFAGYKPIPASSEVPGLTSAKFVSVLAFSNLKLVSNFEEVKWFTQTGEQSKFHNGLVPNRSEGGHTFYNR